MYHRHKQAMHVHRRCSDALGRPENEHDRGSRPRASPAPLSGLARIAREDAPGATAFRPGEHGLDRVAPVGEAPVAARALRRDPRLEGSAVGSSVAAYRGDRSCGYGEASWWRGFVLMTGGTRASRRGGTQAAVPLHGGIHGGPRHLHRTSLRALNHSSRRKTLSVSLQRMTCGPRRGRPSLSLPTRERTFSRRLSETQALASLPSIGENKRGLPLLRRGPVPGG